MKVSRLGSVVYPRQVELPSSSGGKPPFLTLETFKIERRERWLRQTVLWLSGFAPLDCLLRLNP